MSYDLSSDLLLDERRLSHLLGEMCIIRDIIYGQLNGSKVLLPDKLKHCYLFGSYIPNDELNELRENCKAECEKQAREICDYINKYALAFDLQKIIDKIAIYMTYDVDYDSDVEAIKSKYREKVDKLNNQYKVAKEVAAAEEFEKSLALAIKNKIENHSFKTNSFIDEKMLDLSNIFLLVGLYDACSADPKGIGAVKYQDKCMTVIPTLPNWCQVCLTSDNHKLIQYRRAEFMNLDASALRKIKSYKKQIEQYKNMSDEDIFNHFVKLSKSEGYDISDLYKCLEQQINDVYARNKYSLNDNYILQDVKYYLLRSISLGILSNDGLVNDVLSFIDTNDNNDDELNCLDIDSIFIDDNSD